MSETDEFLSVAAVQEKTSRKKDRLYFDEDEAEIPGGDGPGATRVAKKIDVKTLCNDIKVAKQQADEYENRRKECISTLRRVLDPWREAKCREGRFASTVDIECGDFTIQAQYQESFSPFKAEQKQDLQKALGDLDIKGNPTGLNKFDLLFREDASLGVAKAVMNNPERLKALVQKLRKVLSAEEFASYFEYSKQIKIQPNFDANRHDKLTLEENEALVKQGLSQKVLVKVV